MLTVRAVHGQTLDSDPGFDRTVPEAAHGSARPTSGAAAVPAIARFADAARAPFLAATLVPVLLGTAVAWSHGDFHAGWFGLALLGALLVHVGTNTANDYFDHRSGADAEGAPATFTGGGRAIRSGSASPAALGWIAVATFALATALGVVLAWQRGWQLLWLGVGGLALAVFYTTPPLNLASRGLGELAVALGFGPCMVLGAYFVQTQRFDLEPLVASVPLAALIAAVLYVNEFPDHRADARAGKRTLVVRLGVDAARWGYYGLVAVAFLAILAGVAWRLLPPPALLALLTLPLAAGAVRAFARGWRDPARLGPVTARTVFLHLGSGALLAAGYVLAGVLR